MNSISAVKNLSGLSEVDGSQRNNTVESRIFNPVFSIVCDQTYDDVVDRAQVVESKLEEMKSRFPNSKAVSNLWDSYYKHTVDIEMEKLSRVIVTPAALQQRMSEYFNEQRVRLIKYTARKLKKIEDSVPKSVYLCPVEEKDINYKAIQMMTEWYNQHHTFPYPSQTDIMNISTMANIPYIAVQQWFSFERIKRISSIESKETKQQ